MLSKSSLRVLFFSTAVLLGLSGCVAAIGNRPPPASSATLGQQLIDLKKARDAELLTEAEYAAQRSRFLNEKKTEIR